MKGLKIIFKNTKNFLLFKKSFKYLLLAKLNLSLSNYRKNFKVDT